MVSTEDRLAINELFARYNWALDTANGDAVADEFIDGGVFDGSASTWAGREEIKSMVAGSREGDGEFRSQHWALNSVIVGEGDTLTVVSMSICPAMNGSEFQMAFMAYYVDTVVKINDQWKFERRRFRMWDGEAPDVAQLLKQEGLLS